MAEQLRVLATFVEVQGLVSMVVGIQPSGTPSSRVSDILSDFPEHQTRVCCVSIHSGETRIHMKSDRQI